MDGIKNLFLITGMRFGYVYIQISWMESEFLFNLSFKYIKNKMSIIDLYWYLDMEESSKYKWMIFGLIFVCCMCAIFLKKKNEKNLPKKKFKRINKKESNIEQKPNHENS